MEDAGQNLSPKQEKALASLLALGEVKAAAGDARVGETTLWRWLKDETFAQAYRDGRRKVLEASASRLTADSAAASRVLLQIADDAPEGLPLAVWVGWGYVGRGATFCPG